jgi:glycosyltransferase involved in cell wall biosynthesis
MYNLAAQLDSKDLIRSDPRKLKVLISAYACEPDKGSEPGVGWNWAKQIARFHEAWVITRPNNRASIESALSASTNSGLHFIYVDPPKWITFWKKKQRGVRTYYYLWQIAAFFKAKALMNTQKFDLCHHVTFVNDWLPAFFALLPLPFIWGPIGSHPPVPLNFIPNRKAQLLEFVRRAVQACFRAADPFFYLSLFKARKIIMISDCLVSRYPFLLVSSKKFTFFPAISIEQLKETQSQVAGEHSIVLSSVGRLIYIKGFDLTIRAFAGAVQSHPQMELKIIGDGSERSNLQKTARELKVEEKILFEGELARHKVYDELSASDIFIFPSFEGGGMVVLEAMATGLPVICLDYGGPGQMVTEECGIKIKPMTPEQTIKDLSEAILKLVQNPEMRKIMGRAGRKRALQVYNWNLKGDLIRKMYSEILTHENHFKS